MGRSKNAKLFPATKSSIKVRYLRTGNFFLFKIYAIVPAKNLFIHCIQDLPAYKPLKNASQKIYTPLLLI